jgi:hypothetical protein
MRFAGDTFSQAVEQEEENPSTLIRYFPDLKNVYKPAVKVKKEQPKTDATSVSRTIS